MSNPTIKKDTGGGSSKDKYLIVALHQLMEEYGWRGIEKHFGFVKHHIIYVKPDSLLDKIELKANVLGNHMDVDFLGESPKKGLLDRVFDFNVRVVRKSFEISKYVSDDMRILHEQNLRNIIVIVIKQLEEIESKKEQER
ncbi:hypothetical protein [Methanolobus halotolerans]|uniref:Uncharacterized protein n=1 Tax=Methanolobus halotolerans TaxID=2052935 RepID=A0A4E0PW33_9EURY|nr:hypothetical protein [Methanolobus halotolerans]TGC09665.1 hypothetical protein CUN85_04685 [Methanolobus halotolerans]